MQNQVRTTEADGALGVRGALSGLPLAVIGQATSGALLTPSLFSDPDDVIATFDEGHMVQDACYALANFGRSVVCVRTNTGTAAVYGAVTFTGTGTSVITLDVDGSNKPNCDYDFEVRFSTAGAAVNVGVAGIFMEISADGGLSFNPKVPLGTAMFYVIPGTNVKIDFAAGNIANGDKATFSVSSEQPTSAELDAGLDALRDGTLAYELIDVTVPLDATYAGVCSTWLTEMHNAGKHKNLIGSFRRQEIDGSESAAQYITAFDTEFNAFGNTSMYIAAGACDCQSAVTRGRRYRCSPRRPVAALLSASSEELDISRPTPAFALPGVTIRDAKGNPKVGYYDETVNPGLDDVRALTLRTWDGLTGVYVNQPRMISAIGSDFEFSWKRRVMNLARSVAVQFLRRAVVAKPLRVNKTTGKVLESELLALEAEGNSELERAITSKPKASSVRMVLSRNDDILNPPYPLTGKLRMIPLAYPKDVSLEAGWELTEPIVVEGVGG